MSLLRRERVLMCGLQCYRDALHSTSPSAFDLQHGIMSNSPGRWGGLKSAFKLTTNNHSVFEYHSSDSTSTCDSMILHEASVHPDSTLVFHSTDSRLACDRHPPRPRRAAKASVCHHSVARAAR